MKMLCPICSQELWEFISRVDNDECNHWHHRSCLEGLTTSNHDESGMRCFECPVCRKSSTKIVHSYGDAEPVNLDDFVVEDPARDFGHETQMGNQSTAQSTDILNSNSQVIAEDGNGAVSKHQLNDSLPDLRSQSESGSTNVCDSDLRLAAKIVWKNLPSFVYGFLEQAVLTRALGFGIIDLLGSLKTSRSVNKIWSCPSCFKQYNSSTAMRKHFLTRHIPFLDCYICGNLVSIPNMSRHLNEVHSEKHETSRAKKRFRGKQKQRQETSSQNI